MRNTNLLDLLPLLYGFFCLGTCGFRHASVHAVNESRRRERGGVPFVGADERSCEFSRNADFDRIKLNISFLYIILVGDRLAER